MGPGSTPGGDRALLPLGSGLILVGLGLALAFLGLRVRRVFPGQKRGDEAWATMAPGLLGALARTVLLCLVIPAVVWDSDGRGLHDRVAGTAIVRR